MSPTTFVAFSRRRTGAGRRASRLGSVKRRTAVFDTLLKQCLQFCVVVVQLNTLLRTNRYNRRPYSTSRLPSVYLYPSHVFCYLQHILRDTDTDGCSPRPAYLYSCARFANFRQAKSTTTIILVCGLLTTRLLCNA